MDTKDIEDMNAKLEQGCDSQPICDSSDVYDPNTCTCLKGQNFVLPTACPSGLQLSQTLDKQCTCAVAISLQCDNGYFLDQSKNCMCTSISGTESVDSTCPAGSSRPSTNTCYCLLMKDPECQLEPGIISDDQCSCELAESYTPRCSNSDVCQLGPDGCSCVSAS